MTETEMKITAIAPWFGGKRTMAPIIIKELGDHRAYWEPFCGSMAVLLAKEPASMETANDLHGDLINVARIVQDRVLGPMLYRRLRRAMNSQVEFAKSRVSVLCEADLSNEGDCLDRAYNYFLCSWQGMNGVAGTATNNMGFARRFTKNGGHAATRFAGAVDSIPSWRRRLRGVSILSADGIELCEKIEDAAGVAIYADPPYITKGCKYLHDFDDQKWWQMPDGTIRKSMFLPDCKAKKISAHQALTASLSRFKKTRVVVSYYAHPDLAAMYPGWTVVDCMMTKSLVSQGRRDKTNKTESPEILLINGPSFATEAA